MFRFFIPLVLLFTFSVFAQTNYSDTVFFDRSWHQISNKEKSGYYRILQQEDSLIHFWDYYTENKQLQNEGYYHATTNNREGFYTWYDKTGNKSLQGNYENGNRIGFWQSWYQNSNLKSSGLYEKNLRTQEWKWFYLDGNLQSTAFYKEDKLSGKRTWWHKSGEIKQTGFYENGLKTGNWETFYLNGQTASFCPYSKGQKQGIEKTYYKNGQLRSSQRYESGILKEETWYNEAGEKTNKSEITSIKDNYALFWKIAGNGLAQPSFLLGTMHIKDKSAFEFNDSLYQAFDACQGYSMEILPDLLFLYHYKNQEAETSIDNWGLERYSSSDYDYMYDDSYYNYSGYSWMQNVGALFHRDYPQADGMPYFMDAFLYVKAGREGKHLSGLETVEDHLNTGQNLPSYRKNFDILSEFNPDKEIITIYQEGDIEKIEAFMNFISDEEYNYWLLTVRNRKMANTIDSLAQIRPTFNTAGAAHLPGEEGVINLLKEKGYDVTPVVSPFNQAPKNDLPAYSLRKWQTQKHPSFSIQTPSFIGKERNRNLLWNICMDYLTETAYAYTLVADKKINENTILPEGATILHKKTHENYGNTVTEWKFTFQKRTCFLFLLQNKEQRLFLKTIFLNAEAASLFEKTEIPQFVGSVKWENNQIHAETKSWQTFQHNDFTVFAPGQAVIDSVYFYDNATIKRYHFTENNSSYTVRIAEEMSSYNYLSFEELAQKATEEYNQLVGKKPFFSKLDSNKLMLKYKTKQEIREVHITKIGYATFSTLSITSKNDLKKAEQFHNSFTVKYPVATQWHTYQPRSELFSINIADTTSLNSWHTNYDFNPYFYTKHSFTDRASGINGEIEELTFKDLYTETDSNKVLQNLFYHQETSIFHISPDSLDFVKTQQGISTRTLAVRNNRTVLSLEISYPQDLKQYVDTLFFKTFTPHWQTDSISLFENKNQAIKQALIDNEKDARSALLYNAWTLNDLDFLYSLLPFAVKDKDLATNLLEVFNDSLQNDSIAIFIYQLAQHHAFLRNIAFLKLLHLQSISTIPYLDTITQYTFDIAAYDLPTFYADTSFIIELLSVFHKNRDMNTNLFTISENIISQEDIMALHENKTLTDTVADWCMDLLAEPHRIENRQTLLSYLNFLKQNIPSDSLQKVFALCYNHPDNKIQLFGSIYAIQNQHLPPDTLLSNLIEQRAYRFEVLKLLHQQNKLHLAPKTYTTKQAIAEAQLYSGDNDVMYVQERYHHNNDLNHIKTRFLSVKKVKAKGKKQFVYFFRTDEPSEKYITAIGYQPVKKDEFSFDNSLYEEESFTRSKDIKSLQKKLYKRIRK